MRSDISVGTDEGRRVCAPGMVFRFLAAAGLLAVLLCAASACPDRQGRINILVSDDEVLPDGTCYSAAVGEAARVVGGWPCSRAFNAPVYQVRVDVAMDDYETLDAICGMLDGAGIPGYVESSVDWSRDERYGPQRSSDALENLGYRVPDIRHDSIDPDAVMEHMRPDEMGMLYKEAGKHGR